MKIFCREEPCKWQVQNMSCHLEHNSRRVWWMQSFSSLFPAVMCARDRSGGDKGYQGVTADWVGNICQLVLVLHWNFYGKWILDFWSNIKSAWNDVITQTYINKFYPLTCISDIKMVKGNLWQLNYHKWSYKLISFVILYVGVMLLHETHVMCDAHTEKRFVIFQWMCSTFYDSYNGAAYSIFFMLFRSGNMSNMWTVWSKILKALTKMHKFFINFRPHPEILFSARPSDSAFDSFRL